MFLNIKSMISRLLVFLMVLCGVSISLKVEAANCFSYIPFSYNGLFFQLPKNQSFCYFYFGKTVEILTNELSGRVIKSEGSQAQVLAFGESQLLGIEWSSNSSPSGHDLEVIFGEHPITIFAAPNNGPYEVLRQISETLSSSAVGNEKLVLGFNYGTDIFRISDTWVPEEHSPLTPNELQTIFVLPGVFDLFLLRARLSGGIFGTYDDNSSEVRTLYLNKTEHEIERDVQRWIIALENSTHLAQYRPDLIVYPPYWLLSAKESQKNVIKKRLRDFVCMAAKSELFDRILLGHLSSDQIFLADDKRHFPQGTLIYKATMLCD